MTLQLLVPGAPTFFGAGALRAPLGGRAEPGRLRRTRCSRWRGCSSRDASASRPTWEPSPPARSPPTGRPGWRAGSRRGRAGWPAPDLLAAAGLRARRSGLLAGRDAARRRAVRPRPTDPARLRRGRGRARPRGDRDVGPAEHFLGEQHTLQPLCARRGCRASWTRTPWEAWEEAGRPAAARARRRARPRDRSRPTSRRRSPPPPRTRIEEVIAEHERDPAETAPRTIRALRHPWTRRGPHRGPARARPRRHPARARASRAAGALRRTSCASSRPPGAPRGRGRRCACASRRRWSRSAWPSCRRPS